MLPKQAPGVEGKRSAATPASKKPLTLDGIGDRFNSFKKFIYRPIFAT